MSGTTEVKRTSCNRDCPDACGVLVSVEDGRATRLRGDPDDPVTRGFLCERTNRFLFRQYAADRFTRPMLRRDGRLEPVSWDAALDLAAEKLLTFERESGGASILHYKSGGSLGMLKAVPDLLFSRFGPVTVKAGDVCSGAGEHAQELDFGISESHDLFDLLESRTILLWGKNPHTSGVHLIPVLREARAKGATVIGLDPVRTKAVQVCDAFFQPRPGHDFEVAMGIARWLLDHDALDAQAADYCDNLDAYRELVMSRSVSGWAEPSGLAADDVAAVASRFAGGPSAILVGWGLARRGNGAATVRALDALGAVSGNLGIRGGGVSYYFGRRAAFDVHFGHDEIEPPRKLSETRLGAEILAAKDPPVRMIWVTGGNPVSMLPESQTVRRAFERTEFTVVVETHPTDTTDCADLVLPTLTLLEDSDVLGAYGNHFLRASRPVIDPPGEARHELAIIQGLAERLGLGDLMAGSVDDWKRKSMARLAEAGVTLERLEREGAVRNPFAAEVLFEGRRFPTPTGKVNLLTEAPPAGPALDADYPLSLLAVSTPKAQSSQWSYPIPDEPAPVRVHPESAAGLADGAPARLESRVGTMPVVVRHDAGVHRDVVLMDKGGMLRHGRAANALVRAVETDGGGGAAYYDEGVRLVGPGT